VSEIVLLEIDGDGFSKYPRARMLSHACENRRRNDDREVFLLAKKDGTKLYFVVEDWENRGSSITYDGVVEGLGDEGALRVRLTYQTHKENLIKVVIYTPD